jgi:moderate conductance mechanosensitive channel
MPLALGFVLAAARPSRQSFIDWWDRHGWAIVGIVVAAIVVTFIARILVRRFRRKLEGSVSLTQELNLQRAATITHAVSTTVVVAIWVVAFLLILDQFDISLAPFIASAGIAGVALGFGAQSLVRDNLSGFFILLENQFGVGDIVEAQTTASPVTGKVESLTLRITTLRAFDGTLHIIPNGNIQLISNKSRGWARAIVDVRVAYGEDVDRIRRVLEEVFDEVRADASLGDRIRDGPSVLGIEQMSDYALVVRVIADTRPSKRFDVERTLRERISRRFADEGIRVPIPPTMTGGPPGDERPGL